MEYVKHIYQVDKLDPITGISWQEENRRFINVTIDFFNRHMTGNSTINGNTMVGMVLDIIKYGGENDFAQWQFDLLTEMLEVL